MLPTFLNPFTFTEDNPNFNLKNQNCEISKTGFVHSFLKKIKDSEKKETINKK
jgi:hypothetical protein